MILQIFFNMISLVKHELLIKHSIYFHNYYILYLSAEKVIFISRLSKKMRKIFRKELYPDTKIPYDHHYGIKVNFEEKIITGCR